MSDDTKYLINQALVEHLWKQYQVKKDPRWLAEICLNVPFFDNQQVGQEIARLLEKQFHTINQIDEQTRRNDIWRLWKLWKDSDKDTSVRERIAAVFFKDDQAGPERVRGIIRAFENWKSSTPRFPMQFKFIQIRKRHLNQ